MGFPFDYFYSAQLPELNSMSYLAFELEIIKTLKDAGHTVIYKAHPDTLKETAGIFERFADRVETKPFEAVIAEGRLPALPAPVLDHLGLLADEQPPGDVDERHPPLPLAPGGAAAAAQTLLAGGDRPPAPTAGWSSTATSSNAPWPSPRNVLDYAIVERFAL